MRRNLSLIVLFCVVLVACSKNEAVMKQEPEALLTNGFTEYTIPKGSHYSLNNTVKNVSGQSMNFTAQFDSSCAYRISKTENILDLNKLYGFSDCASPHHQNSARFAWRWNGTAIEVHAYWYINGERKSSYMGSVTLMQQADYAISVSSSGYLFKFRDQTLSVSRGCINAAIEGYQLYPYFGGDEVAPHEMKILIKEHKAS